jgi:hypothetical protein
VNLVTFLRQLGPTVLLLCLVAGSWLLWSRTKRASALLQFIAAAALSLNALVDDLYSLMVSGGSTYYRLLSSVAHVLLWPTLVSVATFPIAYLCYAIRQKASNQAMERTADRSASTF